ncbi:MAG: ATP-binding cassette domain-containing protein [Gordonia sp. (in: high G+C Gram-positive bacteria)]|uniref:ABC transporter ATP-binding protein/permease n=1 Tax=Gordonia sp. (in: high G+C Gram-positive bacteria) TaxID=84139 RepID=UPI003BB75960
MGKGFQGAVMRALGAKEHLATVITVEQISSAVIRISFVSDTLLYPDGEKPSAWVRAWFPDVEGGSKQSQRGYTLMDPDPATGCFSVCFLVHEPAGPASSWAQHAQPGDELVVQRMGGDGWELDDPQPAGYLVCGDVAAWPGIRSILQGAPVGVPIRAFIEYTHDDDRQLDLPARPEIDLTVTWVPGRTDGRALVDALGDADYRGWKSWVAAESKATRLVKSKLSGEHGHNKGTMHAQAYWIAGRAMGKHADAADLANAAEAETAAVALEADPAFAAGPLPTAPAVADESVLRPARPAFILSGFIALILAALAVVPLVLFAELAQRLVDGADRQSLVGLAVTGLLVMVIGAVLSALLITVLHFYDQHFAAALRRKVLAKFTRLPLGWFLGRRPAEVRTLAQDDIGALHYLVTHAVVDLVTAVITPLVIIGYLFSVNWTLALVLLIPVVIYVVMIMQMAAGDRPRLTRMLQWNAVLPGEAERYIGAQPVSRVFGDGATVDLPGEVRAMSDFLKDWQHVTIDRKSILLQLNRPMTSMVIVALAGTALIVVGWTPAGAIFPFLILGTSFGDRLIAASYAANGLREGTAATASLDLLLTTPELAQVSEPAARTPGVGPAAVRFTDVSFGYTAGRTVLDGFSLDLPAGGTTAVVGPSGAGKSTVAALATRLWDPDTGSVTLDGVDLRCYREDELRKQIAVVLQDVQLVRGTIAENIALGRPDATRAAIVEAARTAHIAEVIEALPDGYDTHIERDSLSGGQRQRLAIARAILGDPRLVVLDEATAAADPDSEWEVRQGLSRLLAGRTVLVIAHRLHTVAHADLIVVLDEGRIAESGTRDQLLAAGGLFARLHDRAMEALA